MSRCAGIEHGPLPGRRPRRAGRGTDLDVVTGARASRGGLAAAGEGLDQSRLAGAVGSDHDDVLAALDLQSSALDQGPPRDLDPRILHLQHEAPGALPEARTRTAASADRGVADGGVALDALDLLHPRLRLPGLRRLVAEALDEPLHPLDLGLLALDRLAERDLARRLLGPPGVPGAGEVAATSGLELEHRGPDRLEKPAIVGDEHDGGIETGEVALEPLQRGDVEVIGRLVEEQQLRAGSRGRGPAKRGSAHRPRTSSAGARMLGARTRDRASTAST